MIADGMSNDEYHSHDEVVSNSMLSKIALSPSVLWHYLNNVKPPPTAPMVLGSATHTQILEPDLFWDEYAIELELDKRKPENKIKDKQFKAECACKGIKILNKVEYRQVQNMEIAIKNHPVAGPLFYKFPGRNELSIFQKDPETDTEVRIRIDRMLDNGFLVDLKTTDKADKTNFAKKIANYRYNVQAAFYMDMARLEGIEVKKFIFVAVEKKPPFGIGVYVLDDDAINRGRELYRRDLNLYADCIKNQTWPGYGKNKITQITLPRWAFYD